MVVDFLFENGEKVCNIFGIEDGHPTYDRPLIHVCCVDFNVRLIRIFGIFRSDARYCMNIVIRTLIKYFIKFMQ